MNDDVDGFPVQADPQTLAALREMVHDLHTRQFTAHVRSLGIQPPDDRPGWSAVLAYAPDLTERGLVWVHRDNG